MNALKPKSVKMIRKLHLKLSILFIAFFGLVGNTYAQETTSSMSGTVKDKNGPLPGVTITAIHTPTGSKYVTSTRGDGRFNLEGLKVGGPYTISASFIGYSTSTQENINLTLGENFDANFNLSETTIQLKAVVVSTNQNKTFNSNRTGASDIVGKTQIERLPTVTRSLADVTKLTPYGSGGQGNTYGGRNNLYNNITVNGAQFNNTFGLSGTIGGQTGANPISLDAIDQVQVNLAPYDVTQGGFTGAGVNSLTRAGTNSFYGTVYGYYQAPSLVGTKVGTTVLPKQQFNYNLEGLSLGGAIIKNKLFLYVNTERERRSSPATNFVASTPSAPYTGTNGSVISQPKATTLDSLRNFLISKYNYDPGTYQGYNRNFYRNNVTARFDLNISPRSSANLNLFYLRSYNNIAPSNSGSLNGGRQPSLFTLPFSGAGYRINNDLYSGIFELNSRFNLFISNKFQAGATFERDYRASLGSGIFPEVDILGGTSTSPEVTSFGFEPFTAFNKLNSNIFIINDYLKIFKGKHEFTVGTQNQIQSYQNGFSPNYYGSYVFNSINDFYNSANNGVDNAYRYTLSYSALSTDFPIAKVKNVQLGFLGQDKITLDPNFTLNLGLRVDIPIIANTFTDNPGVNNLSFRNGIKVSTAQVPNTKVLLSPRIGFNWDVLGNHTFQVRGGTGIFTGPPPQVWISNQAGNNGVQFGSFAITSNKGAPIGFPFSPDVNKYKPAPSPNNLPTSYNIAVTGKSFNFPQVWRTSLGADVKLFADITATLEGFYTQDINAVYFDNINLPAASTGTRLTGPDNRVRYNSSQIWSGKGGATLSNPNISTAILLRNTDKGYSWATSLKLERNKGGLYTAVIYTKSDSRSVNDGGSIAASSWSGRYISGDPNAAVLGFSQYRVPNRFLAVANYKIEYLHFAATTLGFTFEIQPNGSYSYVYSGSLSNDGNNGTDLWYVPAQQSDINLVDVKSGTTVTYSAAQQWYDLNNYINQDPYLSTRRGQYAERNGLLAPYYHQLNVNFGQDFFIKLSNGKRNILRFTADIINFDNLLNKNWGLRKSPINTNSLLAFKGLNSSGAPTYSLSYLNSTTQTPYTSTFAQTNGSIWSAQLGLRYIFQ